MNQRGFTLVEVIIVIAIIMIAGTAAMGIISSANGNSSISFGINGMTESRCIEGYKFIIGEQGQPRQILDEFGKGVRCQQNSNGGM